MIDEGMRDLVFRFWNLTISQRRDIALRLKLIEHDEIELPEVERYNRALLRAADRGQVAALAREVGQIGERMKPEVAMQVAKLDAVRSLPGYQDRVKSQLLAWAQGRPYHERTNNECTPDFSCCHPYLMETDSEKRWEYYRKKFGATQ